MSTNDLSTVKIKKAIVKIVGVFESEKKSIKQMESIFVNSNGYNKIILTKDEEDHHRDFWYPEFRNMWFGKEDSAIYLKKNFNCVLDFIHREKIVKVFIRYFEIYLMPNGLHFFSIAADTDDKTAEGYSNLCALIRNFYSKISGEDDWVDWIEKNCLDNIQISSDDQHKKVKVDEYSGSKFKLFQVYELEEFLEPTERLRLLFELATVSKISKSGEISITGISERYMNALLYNRLGIFNNYDMLPLLDSFSVLGQYLLDENNINTFKTYNESYFRIYLHALFLKYNLFSYQSRFHKDDLGIRNTFEKFLNSYNLSHISYNFLPNTIYKQIKKALELEEELNNFKERIVNLNQTIREEQQRRTNGLLRFLGLVTSLGSILPAFGMLEKLRSNASINPLIFYSLFLIPLFFIIFYVINYLFPEQLRTFIRRITKK